MSVVYRAHHRALERKVALKLLAPELAEDKRFRERFLRESRLAASLDHPHIVPIYDAGEVNGQLFIAMRYVEGSDLKSVLREEGALEPYRAIALLSELADALDAAHARGLVHRDVKPSNALLDPAGHVYLADFGLTKSASDRSGFTATGQIVGTVDYVAPEQIEGKPVDGRADVYSLGCLLYECLTGEVPFPRDSELAVLWAHVHAPAPKSTAYPALDPVIAKALAKDPEKRYQSCRELVEAAREALGLHEVVVLRDRKPLLLVATGLSVAAAAALAAFFLSHGGGGPAKPSTKPTLAPKVDALQRIDPRTNKLVATIEVGSYGRAVAVGEGAAWVTGSDRTLSRIDPKTNAVAKIGAAGSAPTQAAPGEGAVWVANIDSTLIRLDPSTLKIVSSSLPGGEEVCGPAVVGEGSVWVGVDRGLARVSPDGYLIATVGGVQPCVVTLAAGAGAVWVAPYFSRSVTRVDPVELKVVASIPVTFLADDLAAGREGVWVVDHPGDSVVMIDPKTNRVVGRVRVGHGPVAVAAGEGGVWVVNVDDGTVSRLDPKHGKVVATIRVGPDPTDIAAGEGGVWVTVHPT